MLKLFNIITLFFSISLFTNEISELQLDVIVELSRQNQNKKAIDSFLKLLKKTNINDITYNCSDEEKIEYEDALKRYMKIPFGNPQELSQKIYEDFNPIIKEHPDYFLLNFIIAATKANLGHLDDFFVDFYKSFKHAPDSYLAYKSIAILNLSMWQMSDGEINYKEEAFKNFKKALDKNPLDGSIYKFIIITAEDENIKNELKNALNTLLKLNITIPRIDIYFFVSKAIDLNEVDLASKLIEHAEKWYDYSKAIDSAKNLISNVESKNAKENR